MAWARPDNLHSRLVFWLKILLPLSALAILSTLFMVSRSINPDDAIRYADVDINDLMREPRLTLPNFAGMTTDGAALTLRAQEARLGPAEGITPGLISGLVGVLETPDGARTDLAAAGAYLDDSGQKMVLGSGVTVSNSAGYLITTDTISVALDRTSLDTAGPIKATGPAGQIEAGEMHLGLVGDSYVLVFKGGVRMIYQPTTQGTKE
jgi:lipopolysaccharide export system protein LptC